MAKTTNLTLRHKLLYQVYIRNFTEEGTFIAMIDQLPRLKKIGVDIILLQSIFEATDLAQPDKLGNPIIVKNYEQIGVEYGTFEDFVALVDAIHDIGMQVVLNFPLVHLSRDSDLIEKHPEFFLKNEAGEMYSRIDAYNTAFDLDYSNPKLWDYLIKYLEHWAKYVDGFAANSAPLIRPEFWSSARDEVEDVHPYFYWIGGSIPSNWIRELEIKNLNYLSEGELYTTFDVLDERPISKFRQNYYLGITKGSDFAYSLNWQELMSPRTYVKMRGLEISPENRITETIKNSSDLESWMAFTLFQKGIASITMGEEYGATTSIDIRSEDVIDWTVEHDMTDLITRISRLKKRELFKSGYYIIQEGAPNVLVISYHYYNQHIFGIFKLRQDDKDYAIEIGVPPGQYTNLLDDDIYTVQKGRILNVVSKPIVIDYEGEIELPR